MPTLKKYVNGQWLESSDEFPIKVGNVPIFQSKEVTPTKSLQEVKSDDGYDGLGKVSVKPIPNEYIIPTGTKDITENGEVNVAEFEKVNVNIEGSEPTYETPSITVTSTGLITASANGKTNYEQLPTKSGGTIIPTESEQTAVASGKYTIEDVKIGAISDTYVGSAITKNPTPTASGATVTVPAGYYSTQTTKDVATGSLGDVSATKGTMTNNSITVTPKIEGGTAGYISETSKTGTAVTVSASELVSGNKALTPSETAQNNIDVSNNATVSVSAISSTYVGSGITQRTSSSLTASGATVTVPAGYYASQATKSVASGALATPTINASTGVVTASVGTAGYIATGTSTQKTLSLTTQAAKTVTPTTSEQTAVASGVYTTGIVKVGAIPSNYIDSTGFATVYTGSSTPASSLGANGDIYLKV